MKVEIGKYYRSATGTKEGPMDGVNRKWIEGRDGFGDPKWRNAGDPLNQAAMEVGALIAEWVDEPQIEVGKTYPDRSGREWECIAIKGKLAIMFREDDLPARWGLGGTALDFVCASYTIDLGPVRGEVVKYFSEARDVAGYQHADSKYKATIPTLDGKPAVGTYTGENGLCVKIEEVE